MQRRGPGLLRIDPGPQTAWHARRHPGGLGRQFGRTIYCQGKLTEKDYGRDHHPRCFSIWLAGGGIKPGISYGQTDEMSYNIVENPVHVRDFHATILSQLGLDHEKLSFKYQGLDQ